MCTACSLHFSYNYCQVFVERIATVGKELFYRFFSFTIWHLVFNKCLPLQNIIQLSSQFVGTRDSGGIEINEWKQF